MPEWGTLEMHMFSMKSVSLFTLAILLTGCGVCGEITYLFSKQVLHDLLRWWVVRQDRQA